MNKRIYAIAALAVAGVIFSAGLVVAQEEEEEEMTGAGGGGWFKLGEAKDTFGFYLTEDDMSMSEFVLQARDLGVTVHAYQFDSVDITYDGVSMTGSAVASGMAYVAGVEAHFELTIRDDGPRGEDDLMLVLSGDYSGTWDIHGLGGGQIWVYLAE